MADIERLKEKRFDSNGHLNYLRLGRMVQPNGQVETNSLRLSDKIPAEGFQVGGLGDLEPVFRG